ncbi:MAG TPA: DNA primase [Campylobacterales bacterium]|nr:DNA primase [Campylobacterales bacterium]
MIDRDSIENLKSRLDVVDVVGEYLELKKSGANFKANCPFHGENTPSFVVSPSKQIYHCFGCLAPYEEVRTTKGIKKIEDIEVGDFVFASSGKKTEVINVLKHKPQYQMLKFRTDLIGEESTFTKNHDMIVVSKDNAIKNLPYIRVEKTRPLKFYGRIKKRQYIKPIEINSKVVLASDVKKGDYFLYPVDRDIVKDEYLDLSSYWENSKLGPMINKIEKVKFSEELMWLFGIYLAEGSTYRGGIKFSLHSAEIEYANKIIKILRSSFDKEASLSFPKDRDNSLEVTCSGTNLEYIFKALFNKGAENKKYPYSFNYLKIELREALLKGLMDGDGCYSRRTYTTISRELAYLLVDLSISLKKIPSLYKSKKYIDKNGINHKQCYKLLFYKRESLKGFFQEIEGLQYLFMRVKDIEDSADEELVYDITVKDSSHTFLTKSFLVGNCGVGGDSIKFVMEYEKLNYPEAIEKLADKFNVTLKYSKDDRKNFVQKKILEDLNSYFRRNLDKNTKAKKYLSDRGIYDSSVENFEIGFAPDSDQSLSFIKGQQVSSTEALELGIIALNESGRAYARFIDRITFPIFNTNGKIVGYGGRTISNHPAKYINSPQSKIFDKSRLLYGYHKARSSVAKLNEIIVCEGYLDVIMLHQAGFTNSVATLGTALTQTHIPLLLKTGARVIVAYDGDKAGIVAAFKAATMLSGKSAKGGVVIFGDGQDPAEMVQQHKSKELKELFSKPKLFVEFCFEQILAKYNLSDPLQKEDALKEASSYLKSLSPVLQDEYKSYLSVILQINQKHIDVNTNYQPQDQTKLHRREDISELSMIKTFLAHPHLIDTLLDVVGEEIFKVHKNEFMLLLRDKLDNPYIVEISLRDDIKELSEDELTNQIIKQLIIKNRQKLQIVKQDRSIDFNKKSFILRKINENIKKLLKGELVTYQGL